MSLEKDTVQLIIANALAAANQVIETGCHTLAVQPEGAKLINLEPYQEQRDRFRGAFKTHAIADFADYTKRHAQDRAQHAKGFIAQDDMSAEVLFNLGSHLEPGHGDDTARTLGEKPGCVAVLLPPVEKSGLFLSVLKNGALPKKSFSMGNARDKRYYLECRAIR